MKQKILVTQRSDRHKDDERDYAVTTEFIVEAEDLWDVLTQLAHEAYGLLDEFPVGRYTIVIGEPYE